MRGLGQLELTEEASQRIGADVRRRRAMRSDEPVGVDGLQLDRRCAGGGRLVDHRQGAGQELFAFDTKMVRKPAPCAPPMSADGSSPTNTVRSAETSRRSRIATNV